MDWRIKASLQKILSYTRVGDKLNHIPILLSSNYHENVVKYQMHECIRKFNHTNLDLYTPRTALEIGTGYSLIAPIVLNLLGFEYIVTVDISKDVSFKAYKSQIQFLNTEDCIKAIVEKSIFSRQELSEKLNRLVNAERLEDVLKISNTVYIAPYTLEDVTNCIEKYDYICSQVVFEHISPEFLEILVKQIKQWLKPDAYTVHTVNFVDHFTNSGFFEDKRISTYNFLRYSDAYWKFWAGNPIAYTNRLSYMFYEHLFKENNLTIRDFIGENYKPLKPIALDAIHDDVLKKYKTKIALEKLIEYQRGTFVIKNTL